MHLPLDKLTVKSELGKEDTPALDASRVEKMVFVKYSPPPSSTTDRAEYDLWLERVNYLCDDLHWLLQLPHDKFWCQVIFDPGLHKALNSFLQYAPRSHDIKVSLPDVGKQRQLELSRLIFMTYLRMSTHKESKEHYITPEVFGDILYENFLIDIPKIFDLCALFGQGNGQLLSKMVGNIFSQQPKYKNDLYETVSTILQVFSIISTKCGLQLEVAGVPHTPKTLNQASNAPSLPAMPASDLQDIVLYLSDTSVTLHRFLDVYPAACSIFQEFHFSTVLANFYESVIPEVSNALKQNTFSSGLVKKQLTSKLNLSKRSLLTSFHTILHQTCLQPVLDDPSNDEVTAGCTEEFIHTMSSVLGERKFLAAYEGLFSYQDTVSIFHQGAASIDSSQFDYIQSAINSAFATFGHRKSPRGDTNTGGRTSPDGATDSSSQPGAAAAAAISASTSREAGLGANSDKYLPEDFQTEDYGEGAVACPRPSDVELESMISSVKDLLPHLGEGFLEIALEELGWDPEKVVCCILEERLPPSLQDINPNLPRQPRETNTIASLPEDSDVLESRRNVFDNDEFDMFNNTKVDMSKIHLGKKNKKVDLDDRSVVTAVKATYDVYGSIEQQSSIYDLVSGGAVNISQIMYDDEYDDTYDSNIVGAGDADSADELNNKTVVPRVLLDLDRKKAKNEGRLNDKYEDNNDSDDEDNKEPIRDQFVADPAKLREQAEQRRQSQMARKHGSKTVVNPPSRDVVGGPKGQGQSKEVVRNRQVKSKHKGQYHQAGADRKMNKGMF